MRDRLVDLLRKSIYIYRIAPPPYTADTHTLEDYIAKNLLANGVIVPPCKVGDTVWFIQSRGKITETTVEKIVFKKGGLYLKLSCNSFYETTCRSIGKTVFFTAKEAEQELKGEHNG